MRSIFQYILSICIITIFLSCGSKKSNSDSNPSISNIEKISVNFDNNVSVKDLYPLNENVNEKLSKDPECTAFFNDYLNEWMDFENEMFTRIEYVNTITRDNKKNKSMENSNDITELVPETYKAYKSTRSMVWGLAKTAWNGMSLLKLEKRRNELYNSFSKEKQIYALAMEITINSIIYDSYYKPLNDEMKEAKAGTNFRCIGEQLNDDEKAMNFLKNISDDFMDIQKSYRELRVKIFINKMIKDSTDYSKLVELGERIIANKGNLEFAVEQSSINRFFEKLARLCKKINYEPQKFNPPVNDWSEEKKNNFYLVINDIQNKMNGIVKNLNEPPKQSRWNPWENKKK